MIILYLYTSYWINSWIVLLYIYNYYIVINLERFIWCAFFALLHYVQISNHWDYIGIRICVPYTGSARIPGIRSFHSSISLLLSISF